MTSVLSFYMYEFEVFCDIKDLEFGRLQDISVVLTIALWPVVRVDVICGTQGG